MATPDQVSVVSQQAGRLVQILNESLHIANDSKSIKTRISRLTLAKEVERVDDWLDRWRCV